MIFKILKLEDNFFLIPQFLSSFLKVIIFLKISLKEFLHFTLSVFLGKHLGNGFFFFLNKTSKLSNILKMPKVFPTTLLSLLATLFFPSTLFNFFYENSLTTKKLIFRK